MTLEVANIANIEPPSCLPRKLIMGNVQLLNWRIESEYHVFFKSLSGGVIDQIVGKIKVEDCCSHFQYFNEKLGTKFHNVYFWSFILFLDRLMYESLLAPPFIKRFSISNTSSSRRLSQRSSLIRFTKATFESMILRLEALIWARVKLSECILLSIEEMNSMAYAADQGVVMEQR